MLLPLYVGLLLLAESCELWHVDVRLLLDSIEVLMQPIEEHAQELCRVMLLVAAEHGVELSHFLLEAPWGMHSRLLVPHAMKQMRKLNRKIASSSQRIVLIYLSSKVLL